MDIKPCKTCGSTPVLFKARGDLYFDEYICPKVVLGECKSTEEQLEIKAANKWNEKQQ